MHPRDRFAAIHFWAAIFVHVRLVIVAPVVGISCLQYGFTAPLRHSASVVLSMCLVSSLASHYMSPSDIASASRSLRWDSIAHPKVGQRLLRLVLLSDRSDGCLILCSVRADDTGMCKFSWLRSELSAYREESSPGSWSHFAINARSLAPRSAWTTVSFIWFQKLQHVLRPLQRATSTPLF